MPFGGHQQICRHPLCRLPFIHLLPRSLYQKYLEIMGESEIRINELISIRRSGMSIENFEDLCTKTNCRIIDRTLWLVNPSTKRNSISLLENFPRYSLKASGCAIICPPLASTYFQFNAALAFPPHRREYVNYFLSQNLPKDSFSFCCHKPFLPYIV